MRCHSSNIAHLVSAVAARLLELAGLASLLTSQRWTCPVESFDAGSNAVPRPLQPLAAAAVLAITRAAALASGATLTPLCCGNACDAAHERGG